MSIPQRLVRLAAGAWFVLRRPRSSAADLSCLPERVRASGFGSRWGRVPPVESNRAPQKRETGPAPASSLRAYYDGVNEGRGLWKWLHYLDIYERHLSKFVGRPVTVVEIGVDSGGSLLMWHHYFGARCRVHGVDIQPECLAYADERTVIHVGDQGDRAFWERFRSEVPVVDILIDDGGHVPEEQIITLEEMLPHLGPGGVYICEDLHGIHNPFGQYVRELAGRLDTFVYEDLGDHLVSPTTPFQAAIHSVHLYPYLVAIEKHEASVGALEAPKRGTQWQSFPETAT